MMCIRFSAFLFVFLKFARDPPTSAPHPPTPPPRMLLQTEVKITYGKEGAAESGSVTWTVHADVDRPDLGELPLAAPLAFEGFNIPDATDLLPGFFSHMFPTVEGMGARLDRYLSDHRAPQHATATQRNIKFHHPTHPDPDWLVKLCFQLLIAGATENETGVENLWRSGPSAGRNEYPNFGQYCEVHVFKAWKSAIPFMWVEDESLWYAPREDLTWEVFVPVLRKMNEQRQVLLKGLLLLLLDESMSGWRPKTSARGGLPSISFEPRKPVSLGTMLRNGADPQSGGCQNLFTVL